MSLRRLPVHRECLSLPSTIHTSDRCIGRIAWNTLAVRDKRHVTNVDEMFAECIEHERFATADGSIKSVMTVFPQKVHAVPLFEKSKKKNTPGYYY